jgi:hypothetical protein
MRNGYETLVGKIPHGEQRRRWEISSIMDLIRELESTVWVEGRN